MMTVNELLETVQAAIKDGRLTGEELVSAEGLTVDTVFKSKPEGITYFGLCNTSAGTYFYDVPQFQILWESANR